VAILSGALILYRWPATVTIAVGPENSPLVSYTREIRDALEAARSVRRPISATTCVTLAPPFCLSLPDR
jgi:hypothetical protein